MRQESLDFMSVNRAMAAVLLLYYHLLREGGITNDQTIYVNADDFDPFKYLCVEVSDELSDADQILLRQGAIIHLLCDLNDIVGEYESDYLSQPLTSRILSAAASGQFSSIPEAASLASMVSAGEHQLNYEKLKDQLAAIYEAYVLSRFRSLVAQ